MSKEKFAELAPYILLPETHTNDTGKEFRKDKKLSISGKFNPDLYTIQDWAKLGFSERQAESILKYKKYLGGSFLSKEKFRECFIISTDQYIQLEPFLLLPQHKKAIAYKSFDPNQLTSQDWIKLGFSERQAESILKYKKYLGGSFQSKEKFRECFIISTDQYIQLEPFLLLPQHKKAIAHKSFDPNQLTSQDWIKLGFSEKQAQGILNYKEKILKGRFKTLAEIQNCYMISPEKFEELKPFIRFAEPAIAATNNETVIQVSEPELNTITFQQLRNYGFDEKAAASFLGFRKKLGGFVQKEQILETYNIDKNLAQKLILEAKLDTDKVHKIDILTADETTLKSHPYFRYYTDKIIFYRTSFPHKNDILKKLNAKSGDLEKMRWYLK
ncbi:helix-hairpin-helix domain-containing protein [Elizabethkingia meningoseptica]|nr:helix-hairpin-helix domain-containing protein [Elizabethkingia meningoseptica]MDE5507223.1 helix-hairpin-helix domain-containing protein [Elizabethkingia meningoseptica]MDE5515494.1 helix-hairpin-helix domain-containing protein [Elizabethkingia meningoseptica]MDE5526118.1 helix-hairpin-helix domain-containing protein [Elizabethkingia meningoseptica]MDE5529761.1 helix-hairpin-helix domain-containing protein [Elizabethkingia meningoseptica]